MEKQLFSWNGDWDQAYLMTFIFNNVTLKVNVGNHAVGKKFPSAMIDYEKGQLSLLKSGTGHPEPDDEWEHYPLTLTVGNGV